MRISAGDITPEMKQHEPAMQKGIKAFLRRKGARLALKVAALYRAALKSSALTRAVAIRGSALIRKANEDEVAKILLNLSFDDWNEIIPLLDVPLQTVFEQGGVAALKALVVADPSMFDFLNTAAINYATDRGAALVTEISDTTRAGLQSLIASAFRDGLNPAELSAEIVGSYDFSEARADVIARTELAFAHVQGTLEAWDQSGVVDGKSWLLGSEHDVDDDCDDNVADGTIPLSDDFSSGDDGPPAHPNCVLPGTIVAAAGVTSQMTRWYEGKVVRLVVEGNHEIAVTPNHPVLTGRGWIPAGEVTESDHLFLCSDPRSFVADMRPGDHQVPARVEDVAGSLLMAGGVASGAVPTAAEDFHGDGVPEGEVQIVRSAGFEALKREADRVSEGSLSRRGFALLSHAFIGLRAKDQLVERRAPSTHSRVGGLGASRSRDMPRASRLHDVGGTRISNASADAPEVVTNRQVVATESPSEIDARLSGLIAPAKVIQVSRFEGWSGHVYNLETIDGFYLANGIVVHNCVCDLLAELSPAE